MGNNCDREHKHNHGEGHECCGYGGKHKHGHHKHGEDHECCGNGGKHKHGHHAHGEGHECCGNGHNHEHGCCDNGGEGTMEMKMMKVELEDGTKEEFGVVDIFTVEGYDKEYIALVTPDGEQVYLYEYLTDENGEVRLENIVEDEEFDAVADQFEANIEEE